jgi:GNAT superfamily N-acetyltransferase
MSYSIRAARPGDERALFDLIRALSVYERLEHVVSGNAEQLGRDLFSPNAKIEALIAEIDERAVGFALFFTSYSTFLTRHGVYLEDLFVLEAHRRQGIGRALLTEVKRIAQARGAGRLEWSVLDWNQSAIDFYRAFGAELLPDWRICRVRFGV